METSNLLPMKQQQKLIACTCCHHHTIIILLDTIGNDEIIVLQSGRGQGVMMMDSKIIERQS